MPYHLATPATLLFYQREMKMVKCFFMALQGFFNLGEKMPSPKATEIVLTETEQKGLEKLGTVQKSPICGKNTFTIYSGFAPPYMAIKRLLR